MDSRTRSRKACDACSIRKVKCDESGPPCRSCAGLDIPCTYDRPSRRRGPPNRHAEALKKRKIDHSTCVPSSISKRASATPPLDVEPVPQPLSGESICSLQTLKFFIDDFFTYIHPLIPVPHEPTFRAAFERREDRTNRTFLALLAGMVAALTASFPRRPKLHLKSEAEKAQFPNSVSLVRKCHDIAVRARGPGYLDRSNTVDDAAISYFLCVGTGFIYDMHRCRIYLSECVTILRVYNLFQRPAMRLPTDLSSSGLEGSHVDSPRRQRDLIAQEMGRRLFYVCFVGYQTLRHVGNTDERFCVPPETPTDPYPPLPLEIDDEYIFSTHINPQPDGTTSLMAGFNANVRAFSSYGPLVAWEMAFGNGEVFDWERQRMIIWEGLQKAKDAVLNLPADLALHQAHIVTSYDFDEVGSQRKRRAMQHEIQKANIHISQLSTRSYLVDKYWSLYEAHKSIQRATHKESFDTRSKSLGPEDTGSSTNIDTHAQTDHIGRMMHNERGLVIKDLLYLLTTVNEMNMEPNGVSLTYKVRQVASTLLDLPRGPDPGSSTEVNPTTGSHPISTNEAETYLQIFVDILMRLECLAPRNVSNVAGSSPETADSYIDESCEEEDLRQWASLKEYQRRFAEAGGVLYYVQRKTN